MQALRIITKFAPRRGMLNQTSDVIITQGDRILLIERGRNPFRGCWALPGGFIDPADARTVLEKSPDGHYQKLVPAYSKLGAMREAHEEVGVEIDPAKFEPVLTVARGLDVDPRSPTLTHVFRYELPEGIEPKAGDDAKSCSWFAIDKLDPKTVAFDHYMIIREALFADSFKTNRIVSKDPFSFATDVIVTQGSKILLITRGKPPYKNRLALPGGRIDVDDALNALKEADDRTYYTHVTAKYAKMGAMREAEEEISIVPDPKKFPQVLTVMRDANVDPRAPTVSYIFHYELPEDAEPKAGDDAAACQWVDIGSLDRKAMAFDHYDIVQEWLANRDSKY